MSLNPRILERMTEELSDYIGPIHRVELMRRVTVQEPYRPPRSWRWLWSWMVSGKPLSALLRPTRPVTRLEAVAPARRVVGRVEGTSIVFDPTTFNPWVTGPYVAARLTSLSGTEIGTAYLTQPLVIAPADIGTDIVTLTTLQIEVYS